MDLCISCRASEPKRQKHWSAEKWGFRRFQKEFQKMRKTALFAHFLRKKCGFPHFLALFLESAETPLFLQINVFAVWALRLDRKYTIMDVRTCMLVFPRLRSFWLGTSARMTPGRPRDIRAENFSLLGDKNWTRALFSQTCRAPPGYPGKIPGYPAKKFGFPGFRRTYRTFWPPPLQVEDPNPAWRYPDWIVWVWVPFSYLIFFLFFPFLFLTKEAPAGNYLFKGGGPKVPQSRGQPLEVKNS